MEDILTQNTEVKTLQAEESGAGRTDSGEASRSNEVVLKQNTIYIMRATATAAGYINFDMDWYEHTDKTIDATPTTTTTV